MNKAINEIKDGNKEYKLKVTLGQHLVRKEPSYKSDIAKTVKGGDIVVTVTDPDKNDWLEVADGFMRNVGLKPVVTEVEAADGD